MSALLPLYHTEGRSTAVAQAVAAKAEPLCFSWLHEIEFQNALQLKRFRGEATQSSTEAALDLIRSAGFPTTLIP